MNILIILVATVLSAWFYRQGGLGGDWMERHGLPRWLGNTKWRDIGCSLVVVGTMMLIGDFSWWQHVLAGIATFGALTTYWDELFGYDCWWFHGFMIGLSAISYVSLVQLVARSLLNAILMQSICDNTDNDWVEELSRGAILAITLIFYLGA